MFRSVILLASLATSLLFAQPSAEEGWNHLQSSDGIDIYQRIEASGAVTIQATATLEAPMDDLVPFVEKAENFSTWLAEVSNAATAKTASSGGTLATFCFEPSGSGIRFAVVAEYSVVKEAGKSFVGKFTNRPELFAAEAGYERLNEFQGFLILRSEGKAVTELSMKFTVIFDETFTRTQAIHELKVFVSESAANLAMKTTSMVIR